MINDRLNVATIANKLDAALFGNIFISKFLNGEVM